MSQNLINAMFEPQGVVGSNSSQEHEIWDLPKLKGPVKGPAISQSLANLINATCTSQCVTDELVAKYKVPVINLILLGFIFLRHCCNHFGFTAVSFVYRSHGRSRIKKTAIRGKEAVIFFKCCRFG